jgi:type I restriction enzyme S subunit
MNLETFFQKFELFADAPNAVTKMRDVILDLAVKGRLTDRDLECESVKSKYLHEPIFHTLPTNWRLLNFGKYCDIQGGNQPPKSQFSDQPKPGYIRMFQIRDLGENPVPVYIPIESTNRFCRTGEILIGRYGASVGKVFWAQDGAYNVALAKFIFPEDALSPDFAFWILKSNFFQVKLAGASRSAQAGFNKGDLASIDFPLPPLAEQKRIVAKVNELMTLCDHLETQQRELETQHTRLARASLSRFAEAPTPENLEFLFHTSYDVSPAELRKSILVLAVQGKLVPRASEPRICTLESILAEASINGVSNGPTSDTSATEILRISAGTSRNDFYVDEDDFKHVTLSPGEIQKFRLEPGDLLACRFNGNLHYVGRFSYYRGESGRIQVNPDKLIRFRINTEKYFPRYVCLAMNAAPTRAAIEAMCATTAGNIGLSAGRLKTVEIPLPSLAEQRQIVAKVNELTALVDQLETQLTTARNAAINLLDALVIELTQAGPAAPRSKAPQQPKLEQPSLFEV